MAKLIPIAAGLLDYGRCLAEQERLHASVVAGAPDPYVVVVEHPSVLTLGKNADPGFLLFATSALEAEGVAVVRTDRGGEVTAHEPGQLVAYPILRLADFGLTPRRYVTLLEEAVIRTLSRFGVEAATDPEHPGVWLGRQKICAIGVRIKQRATLHGLALNVKNSLEMFQKIVPCGIAGRGVTSLARVLGRDVEVSEAARILTEELARALGVPLSAPVDPLAAAAGCLPANPRALILS